MQSSQQLRAHNYRATKRLDHTDHAAKKWTVSLWSYSMPPRRPKPFTIPVNLEYSTGWPMVQLIQVPLLRWMDSVNTSQ